MIKSSQLKINEDDDLVADCITDTGTIEVIPVDCYGEIQKGLKKTFVEDIGLRWSSHHCRPTIDSLYRAIGKAELDFPKRPKLHY